jgi:hypothetical protein
MGMFDTFGTTQLKAGECLLHQYEIGDSVPLKDGVYAGADNFVVIQNGMFVAELEKLYDNFGSSTTTPDEIEMSIWN